MSVVPPMSVLIDVYMFSVPFDWAEIFGGWVDKTKRPLGIISRRPRKCVL